MWRATFRSLPTGTFARKGKSSTWCRDPPLHAKCWAGDFLSPAKGVPKGPRLIFSRQRKNFFTAGDPRGSRGFGGEKNLERRNSGRKKSTKRLSNEKIVQNGRTVRSARGVGVCFKCKIIFFTENAPDPSELNSEAAPEFLHFWPKHLYTILSNIIIGIPNVYLKILKGEKYGFKSFTFRSIAYFIRLYG